MNCVMAGGAHVAADGTLPSSTLSAANRGGRAVALVIVRVIRGRPGLLHRQPRLGAVEGPGLPLLVDHKTSAWAGGSTRKGRRRRAAGGEVGVVESLNCRTGGAADRVCARSVQELTLISLAAAIIAPSSGSPPSGRASKVSASPGRPPPDRAAGCPAAGSCRDSRPVDALLRKSAYCQRQTQVWTGRSRA